MMRDELLDLGGSPGHLEDEMIGRRVDDLGAEGVGEPQRLDALLALPRHLDQRQLALDRPAGRREVGHRMHRHQPLELVLDLGEHHAACRW